MGGPGSGRRPGGRKGTSLYSKEEKVIGRKMTGKEKIERGKQLLKFAKWGKQVGAGNNKNIKIALKKDISIIC